MDEIVALEKTEHQISCEQKNSGVLSVHRRIITKESKNSPCKVGEIVVVKIYGTLGCWDIKNRWVDFYCSEDFYYSEMDKILVTLDNK